MAKRDMIKTAAEGSKHLKSYYDATSIDFQQLYEMAKNKGIWAAFDTCFKYGYELGHRATIAGQY